MRAAIYNGKQDISLTEMETPSAGENDIVVRNIYSSICGTDVAVYLNGPNTGHKVTVGGEFGREMVSEVVQVGKNVKDIHIGDRVYPYSLLAKGDPKRAGTVGGFSEYVLIPNAELNKQVEEAMVNPIELDELLLRVRALLRRANIEMNRKLSVGNLELDADAMTAVVDGEEIPVTIREFNIP